MPSGTKITSEIMYSYPTKLGGMSSALPSTAAPSKRAPVINERLAHEHPDARCELDFDSPLQLLVATVLSAQCTDARVNSVTPELFRTYPTAADYAAARREDLEAILRPLGFQRAKAGHLMGIGERLGEDRKGHRQAHCRGTVDDVFPPRYFSRPAGLPRPEPGVWGLRGAGSVPGCIKLAV